MLLACSAAAVAVLGMIILSLVATAMSKDPDQFKDIAPVARFVLEYRAWWPVACAVPLAIGVAMVLRRPSRSAVWMGLLIGTLWLAGLTALLLITFFALLKPLYEYQPL